ncbi:hypothetical protein [Sulfuricurvum sp.]|uniref:hypothetical protein n=1 Tax=Sulfuricurvum sp. TaxID=2025608 RepID=UPI002E358051|nr:hypothetical protein [Sulfuricurvum sp.]HEX5328745.1 hypothetical protein [Sulfuricurvum sp.]
MKQLVLLLLSPFLLIGGSINTRISFTSHPQTALRTITSAFNAIGYRLDINSFIIDKNSGELNAIAIGTKPFNANALGENLKEQAIRIEKARMDQNTLYLELDTQNASWNVPVLGEDEGVELKRVSVPQWFRFESAGSIRIQPPYSGRWYPDIAVFNSDMELLSSFRSTEPKEEFESTLPDGALYLKVSNAQGMKMMKEGMWIESVGGR